MIASLTIRRLSLYFACSFVAACVTSSSPPAISPTSTVSPLKGAGSGEESPFALAFSGPSGPVQTHSQINLVFNRPLRAISGAEQAPGLPITITPPAAGRWQWVGTHAVTFIPEGGQFPPATRFTVTLPSTLAALNGEQLGKTTELVFETPLPRVESSFQTNQRMDAGFTLAFNQAVAPSEVERLGELIVLQGKAERRIGFKAVRKERTQSAQVTVVPNALLPKASQARFVLAAGVRGEAGSLVSSEPFTLDFETFGPMRVKAVRCDSGDRCRPGEPVSISFSNPARFGDIKRALQIKPSVPLVWSSWLDDNESVSDVRLVGEFKAGATYQVQVSQLSDDFGQPLSGSKPYSVSFGDFPPQVELGIEGTVLPSSQAASFEVGSVNAGSFQFVSAALDTNGLYGLLNTQYQPFGLLKGLPHGTARTFQSGGRNRMTRQSINLVDSLSASGGRGVVGVGVSYRDELGNEQSGTRLINVTSLGLSAKVSSAGSLVWVTDLETAQPIPSAEVELFGTNPPVSKKYRTDASGLVQIPSADFAPLLDNYRDPVDALLIARSGQDMTYRPVRDFIEPWRLDVSMDLSRRPRTYGMLFTERGLYRPGDTLQVKGLIREEARTGNRIPASRSFTLVLKSASGEEVSKNGVKLSSFGSFATNFRVPETAQLGSWMIDVQELEEGNARTYFDVAEYRPVEFKVTVETDPKGLIRDAEGRFEIRGDYLFGAPMAGASVAYSMTRESAYFAPPGSESFIVDDTEYRRDQEQQGLDGMLLERQETKLDAKGRLAVTQKLTLPKQVGPERISLEAEITDLSRQTQAGSALLLVHPASFYLGLEMPKDWFADAPGKIEPRVVALSFDGKRLTGKKVELNLIRRRWTVVREQTQDGVRTRSELVDAPVAQCTLTTGQEPSACPLQLVEGGYYLIVAKAKDERGRAAQAALGLYGIGKGSATWRDNNTQSLELVLNKKQYKVGDVARVLVKSPYPEAEALVTVEREGITSSERVHLRGSTPTVNVPITAEMEPNAFVSVHLLKASTPVAPGASAAKRAVTAPSYRLGYAELRIDPEARRLSVQIKPDKAELRPGSEVRVALQVHNHNGRGHPAEVTFFAVDEGVLSLIGYKTPDPLPRFTVSRPLQVATLETRDALAQVRLRDLTRLIGSEKGDEGGGGGLARKDFRQSAYFNPSVITDESGRAEVSFKLPDSLTTYRLMAVAVSKDDRYGFGESQVVTNKELMLRPALPRFLRAGDDFEASVIVAAKHFGPSKVEVTAEFSGVTLKGESTREVQLEKDGSAELRFAVSTPNVGQAKLRFTARAADRIDRVEITREVKSPATLEAVALYGQTNGVEAQALGDLSDLRSDRGGLEITLASTALVGLDGGIEHLVDYPYSCTEQLASRLAPLLPLRALATRYNLKLPDGADALARSTLGEILKRQRGDGGFGLWPDSPRSLPWVSSYALWLAHLANETHSGLVSASVFDRGAAYLRAQLSRVGGQEVTLAEGAFMVMVLGELGRADSGYLNTRFDQRSKLPLVGRALLLRAAVKSQASEIVGVLRKDLESHISLDGNRAALAREAHDDEVMSSTLRTHAIVLWALLAADPRLELAAPLARTLLAGRSGGTWSTTQETAFSLFALAEYAARQEKELPSFVARAWLGEEELVEVPFGVDSKPSVSTFAPMSKLVATKGNLAFQKQGSGTLFYEARLKYAKQTLPTTALDRGFYIRRTLRSIDPASLTTAAQIVPEVGMTSFRGADLVLADIVVVTATPRKFVVIDDPLPAGLEAVNTSFATTAQSLDPQALAAHSAYQDSWYRNELRDDRSLFFIDDMPAGMYHYRYLARATTLGKFMVPPTQVFEMYQPEVSGRTAATQVQIQ